MFNTYDSFLIWASVFCCFGLCEPPTGEVDNPIHSKYNVNDSEQVSYLTAMYEDLSEKDIRKDKRELRREILAAREKVKVIKAKKREIEERARMLRAQRDAKVNTSKRVELARELEIHDRVEVMIREGAITQEEWVLYQQEGQQELRSLIESAQPLTREVMAEVEGWIKAAAMLAPSSQPDDDQLAEEILEEVVAKTDPQLEWDIKELIWLKIKREIQDGKSREEITTVAQERVGRIISGRLPPQPRRPPREKRDRESVEVHVIESSQEASSRRSQIGGPIRSVTPKNYDSSFENVIAPTQLREVGENSKSLTYIRSSPGGEHSLALPENSIGGKDTFGFFLCATSELFEGLRGDMGRRWAKDEREAVRNLMLGTAKSVLFSEQWDQQQQRNVYRIRLRKAGFAPFSPFLRYIFKYQDGNEDRKRAWMELLSPSGTHFQLIGSQLLDVEKLTMCAIFVIGEVPGAGESGLTYGQVVKFSFEIASRLLGHMVTTVAALQLERTGGGERKRAPKARFAGNTQGRVRASDAKPAHNGKKEDHGGFQGNCRGCGAVGHKKRYCPNKK